MENKKIKKTDEAQALGFKIIDAIKKGSISMGEKTKIEDGEMFTSNTLSSGATVNIKKLKGKKKDSNPRYFIEVVNKGLTESIRGESARKAWLKMTTKPGQRGAKGLSKNGAKFIAQSLSELI